MSRRLSKSRLWRQRDNDDGAAPHRHPGELDELVRTTGLLSDAEQRTWATARAKQLAEYHAAIGREILTVHAGEQPTVTRTTRPTRAAA